jgi:hypothetical protein
MFATANSAECWFRKGGLAAINRHLAHSSTISPLTVYPTAYRVRGQRGRTSRALIRQDTDARQFISSARGVPPEDIIVVEGSNGGQDRSLTAKVISVDVLNRALEPKHEERQANVRIA